MCQKSRALWLKLLAAENTRPLVLNTKQGRRKCQIVSNVTATLDKRSKRLKRNSHVERAVLIPLIPRVAEEPNTYWLCSRRMENVIDV